MMIASQNQMSRRCRRRYNTKTGRASACSLSLVDDPIEKQEQRRRLFRERKRKAKILSKKKRNSRWVRMSS